MAHSRALAKLAPQLSVVAAAVLLLLRASGLSADPPPLPDEWKFDVLHLKNGKSLQGLLDAESPKQITFRNVRRSPGAPAVVIVVTLSPAEVDHIDRLDAREREVLTQRLRKLQQEKNLRLEDLPLQPAPWGAREDGGLKYTSECFVLVSNAAEDVVRRAAVRLERIYAAYQRYLPPRHRSAPPTTILLVQSPVEYRELLRRLGQEILNPAFYDAGRNRIYCACEIERLGEELERVRKHHDRLLRNLREREAELVKLHGGKVPDEFLKPIRETRQKIERADRENERRFQEATERLFRTLYHEAFHAYLANFVYTPDEAEVPRWLNEGLAQVFETGILEAGEIRVSTPDPNRLERARTAVRQGQLVPLADLLEAGPKQFLVAHASEQQASDRYYLASWALAFYLAFEQRKLGTPELDQYVAALKRGAAPAEAFRDLAGQPLAAFERAFHQYLLHLRTDGSVDRPAHAPEPSR